MITEQAKIDAEILEAKIAALVDEFEQKHIESQTQVSVVTSWRDAINDKYSISKGGGAQIVLHDLSYMQPIGQTHRIDVTKLNSPISEIFYISE